MLCANKRCFALLAVVTSVSYAADEAYVAEIQKWRQENDDFLRSERSPLRLVGRFQVEEGDSRLGSDPASTIVFPDRAPGQTGTLARRGGAFSFEAAKGTPVTVNGQPLTGATSVKVAKPPAPSDRISTGDFSFAIRPLGDDYYLLLQDSQALSSVSSKGPDVFQSTRVTKWKRSSMLIRNKKKFSCPTRVAQPRCSQVPAMSCSSLWDKRPD
jgi:hypothetical protein